MELYQWAAQWGVAPAALDDLRRRMGLLNNHPAAGAGKSETAVQQRVRVVASQAGARLWRNNSGVAFDKSGRPVRFGLCNDSKQLNAKLKSSDLIGITPMYIEPRHVGYVAGVFTAYECKPENWKYSAIKREIAQLAFVNLVTSLGGIARFITNPENI